MISEKHAERETRSWIGGIGLASRIARFAVLPKNTNCKRAAERSRFVIAIRRRRETAFASLIVKMKEN